MAKMIFSKILIRIVPSQLVFNEYDSFSYQLFNVLPCGAQYIITGIKRYTNAFNIVNRVSENLIVTMTR